MNAVSRSEELTRPFVGIVKTVVKEKGYGFIMIEYQKDIYFKIKECHIIGITPYTYVAFKKRVSPRTNRIEAYDIKRVSDYKDELLEIQNKLLVSEKDLIYYCNKDLFDNVIEGKTENIVFALKGLSVYIDNINIDEIIDSYSVTVREGHIYKPGDDDTAIVDYEGGRTQGIYLYRKGSFPRNDWQRDVYLDKILPEYRENIFYERAFCPWEDILAGFGDLTEYRKKAEEKTRIARQNARKLYDKEEHKNFLINFLNRKKDEIIDDYKRSIERSLQGSLSYAFHLDVKIENMKY